MNNQDFDKTQEDFGTMTLKGKSTFGKFCFDMRERLMARVSKYGVLHQNYPKKVHALDSLLRRLDLYIATGNVEYLVDAANFVYIEYTYPSHPDAHSGPTDVNAPGLVVRTDGV